MVVSPRRWRARTSSSSRRYSLPARVRRHPPRTAGDHPDLPLEAFSHRVANTSVRAPNRDRTNASFWYGFASVQTMGPVYSSMAQSKDCGQAKAFNDRLNRTRESLMFGASVSQSATRQLLGAVSRYEEQMPKVKAAFKCTNF